MAEDSTGAGKSPQGLTEVGVGIGVCVEVGRAVGVNVGGRGMKGVGVEVALGSTVARGPMAAEPLGMLAPGIQLQEARITHMTKSIGLAANLRVKSRFDSVLIVIILVDVQ
jgi:hypothetical protein